MHASLYRIVNICSIFFMIENISCFSDFYGVYMFCMLGLKAGVGGGGRVGVYYGCETIRLCCRCNTVVIQSVEVPVTFYD